MYRFLVADDHAVVRRGIKEILSEGFPLSEIQTAESAEEVMSQISKADWDMVITDIMMPGRNGLELLHDIKKHYPDIPVLILSIHADDEYAVRAIKAGSAGYLNKDVAVESELIKAAETILHGRKYISPSVAEVLAKEISSDKGRLPHELLSDRELEIFRLIAQGHPTGKIAQQLSISVHTVGSFRKRILVKMNFRSNAEIVTYAVKHKLV